MEGNKTKNNFDPKAFRESITLDKLNSQLNEFINLVYGKNFEFRPNQREIIINTIYNVLHNNFANQIIEAPTGSGKSIINIICATFLARYYKKSSYILCSDLFLFSQYENAIKANKYLDENVCYIKGQYGNYKCYKNGEDIRNGNCRAFKTSWGEILMPFMKKYKNSPELWKWPCAKNCEYCKQKFKVRDAKVVITTYQNLLFSYIRTRDIEDKLFAKQILPFILRPKTLLFCDEAHNIPAIVQQHYTPTFKLSQLEEIFKPLYDYCVSHNIDWGRIDTHKGLQIYNDTYTWEWYKTNFNNFIKIMDKKCYKNYEILGVLRKYYDDLFWRLKAANLQINDNINLKIANYQFDNKTDKIALDPEDWEILNICLKYEEFFCKLSDLMTAFDIIGHNFLLKKINEPRKNSDEEKSWTIHCLAENFLCDKFFLSYSKNKIYTSATIGNKYQFDQNLGIPENGYDSSKLYKIPSSFDFKNSPIYFINRYSMSYKNKWESFPYLVHYINEIGNKLHKNERGIIQTGSYENTKYILDSVSPEIKSRLFIYNNSKEKDEIINKFKQSPNGILIGPTLTQGIDLPGDLCRFVIIVKVPYMNLKDDFVIEKSKIFPYWYNSQASTEIIQGIGRGVRYNGDYATTYILDRDFDKLYNLTKKQYPKEIQNRLIEKIQTNQLFNPNKYNDVAA